MASNWFLDTTGGSDAQDGSTFAKRALTLGHIAPAAGDTIRVMGSPDPVDMGQTASWTGTGVNLNTRRTVTLTTGVNVDIDNCDSAWTSGTGGTATASTTRKEGTHSASIAISPSQSAGTVLAYHNFSSLDLSAYQQISFWVRASAGVAANLFKIRLSTTNAGTTGTHEFTINRALNTSQWTVFTFDNGSNMNAAILSVALVAAGTTGTPTLLLDNIIACKDHTAAGALSLQSLIGKNGSGTGNDLSWWGIKSISTTTITLDEEVNAVQSASTTSGGQGYDGTTESAEIWRRETLKTASVATSTTNVEVVPATGTAGNIITISGGWNTTDMTTQTLNSTIIDGLDGFGRAWYSTGRNYITWDKLGAVRFNSGFFLDGTQNNHLLSTITTTSNHTTVGLTFNAATTSSTVTTIYSNANLTQGILTSTNTDKITFTTAICNSNGANGIDLNSSGNRFYFGTVIANNNNTDGIFAAANFQISTAATCNYNNYGIQLSNGCYGGCIINNLTTTFNGASGFSPQMGIVLPMIQINTWTSNNNTTSDLDMNAQPVQGGNISLVNATLTSTTKISTIATGGNPRIYSQLDATTANNHKIFSDGGQGTPPVIARSETGAGRHTASGIAWALLPGTSDRDANYPAYIDVAEIAVNANTTVTIKAWIMRTTTNLTSTVRILGNQVAGVSSDVTVNGAAGANTYEQVTLTASPTALGVLKLRYEAYSSDNTSIAYIDDLVISST